VPRPHPNKRLASASLSPTPLPTKVDRHESLSCLVSYGFVVCSSAGCDACSRWLLYHESDLRIEEHYTDTAGFTDHVFALCHLLGFRFAPRIRDLADKRLYVPGKSDRWSTLDSLIGGSIKHIERQFGDVIRLAASIQQGAVTASLILRKPGSYPRQNSLAVALHEVGRIERTLFMLEWLRDPTLRRRVSAGLNKGEAHNARLGQSISTDSAKSAIAPSRTSAIEPAG